MLCGLCKLRRKIFSKVQIIDKIYQKAFESKEEKFDIVYLCKFSPI